MGPQYKHRLAKSHVIRDPDFAFWMLKKHGYVAITEGDTVIAVLADESLYQRQLLALAVCEASLKARRTHGK